MAEPIRRTLAVRCSPERAFAVFTEEMGAWWPMAAYSRAYNEFGGAVESWLEFQPRLGGSILEHLSNGEVLPWGEVTRWEPSHRVVLGWHPHSLPEPPTELEVTFASADEGTLVKLEHRGWDQLSEGFRLSLYDIYVRGWDTTLELYAAAAEGPAA